MSPKYVYVVYDQLQETIKSVHSDVDFAKASKLKYDDDLIKRNEFNTEKQITRFTVVSLEEAVEWLTSPFKP